MFFGPFDSGRFGPLLTRPEQPLYVVLDFRAALFWPIRPSFDTFRAACIRGFRLSGRYSGRFGPLFTRSDQPLYVVLDFWAVIQADSALF